MGAPAGVPFDCRDKILAYNPIAYWPMNEAAGLVANCAVNPAQNGTYTGVTLGQPGIGDGCTCPYFDGVNDNLNVQTATLEAAFNGSEGTCAFWMRFDAGAWTDGNYHCGTNLRDGNPDYVWFYKHTTNGNWRVQYSAGGTVKSVFKTGVSDYGWLHVAMTWSASADEMRVYWNGVQDGATQTGLGIWTGDGNFGYMYFGSYLAGAHQFLGWLAHAAVWDTALGAAAIADLATL